MNEGKYHPIIGLEIHVELKTNSKMFCGCPADWFGKPPNSVCCPVCLGLPGALPVPNKKAVEWCVMLGLALNCEIPLFSKFDRKNYFYPDLPKGYQISQYDQPFAVNGWLEIRMQQQKSTRAQRGDPERNEEKPSGVASSQVPRNDDVDNKKIRIRRVHMEEDTGKLVHATVNGEKCTLIDFNRSGVPLVEIVTEPDIRSSEEARTFLKKLYQIIRYLGISDADMEKGSMRLEPNVSVIRHKEAKTQRSKEFKESDKVTSDGGGLSLRSHESSEVEGSELPSYKVEVKNINSFNFAKKAIDFEIERQIEILSNDELPKQETRGWDEKKGITYSQRSKEEAQDYRYFPEPDIPPIRWKKLEIEKLRNLLPELPDAKLTRFTKDYGLSEYDAVVLTDEKKTAEYYDKAVSYQMSDISFKEVTSKIIANWIINKKADISKVTTEELISLISQNQQVTSIDEQELDVVIKQVIESNQKAVSDYKKGKHSSIMFLVGQVMRELKGKGNPQTIRKILEKRLQ